MKKLRKAKQRKLAVQWVDNGNFDVEFRPVKDVYAKSPNIIVLPFASTETAFFSPPPMAA